MRSLRLPQFTESARLVVTGYVESKSTCLSVEVNPGRLTFRRQPNRRLSKDGRSVAKTPGQRESPGRNGRVSVVVVVGSDVGSRRGRERRMEEVGGKQVEKQPREEQRK